MPTDDNSWDDVYAELGIEAPKSKPAPPPEPVAPPEAPVIEPEPEVAASWAETTEVFAEGVVEDMIVQPSDEGDEGEVLEGEAGDSAEGEPGANPEKKRRRRRRRRGKKGGSPEEAAASADGQPAAAEVENAEEEQEVLVPAGEMEDNAPSETLRDLIATWNVPSWDEIIGGLYRPER